MNKMQKKLGSRRHHPHRRPERSTVGKFDKCLPSGKTVGCITGVFRFFARQQNNSSTKRLPSGGRKNQFGQSPPRSLPPPEKRMKVEETGAAVSLKQMLSLAQTHSCESPRSPTLPPEIRNPGTLEVTDSPRFRRATLMERLMGLDDAPVGPPESGKEKWRKIVVTADNRDGHLESLKRIIDAAVDRFSQSEDGSEEQPSPVSVLDLVSRTEISADKSKQLKCSMLQPIEEISLLQSGASQSSDIVISEEKNEEARTRRSTKESDVISSEGMPWMLKRSEPVEDYVQAIKAAEIGRRRLGRPRWTVSQAMVETVCEVLERVSWEERKEAMGVVVALERGIFGDLVEDLGRDLALNCRTSTIRRSCRKRLHF